MWFRSVRLGGVELCVTRADTRFADRMPLIDIEGDGEVYLYWLEFELIISLTRRVERRRGEAKRLGNDATVLPEESNRAATEPGGKGPARAPASGAGRVQEA